MGGHKVLAGLGLVFVLVLLVTSTASAQDPFEPAENLIMTNIARWAGVILSIGCLAAGSAYSFGSNRAPERARAFFIGAIFLLMAALGPQLLTWMRQWIRI